MPLAILSGTIVGAALAPRPSWATLPVAILVAGMALFSMPAALIMRKIGRKRGFIGAAIIAAAAALLAASAIGIRSFWLFCAALFLIGVNLAFIQQYRFAAAESVAPSYTGRAISFVLVGGIAAGLMGPEIGRTTRDWLPYGAYTASFVVLAVLYLVAALLLLLMRTIAVTGIADSLPERPLHRVVSQRHYLVAVWSSVVAFGVMSFVMTAAPISAHVIDKMSIDSTARVLQSHMLGMYIPSLFSGFLVERLGSKVLQTLGVVALGISVAIAASGHHLANYLVGLAALGIGWNFLFVGGTVLLTRSYYPSERFKAQGVNDFTVFTLSAVGTFSAGSVLAAANWEMVNLLSLPFLVITLGLVLTTRART
ncbi:MAG: MFS transporter [Chloroflexi bacterium]|nr:MFS transporter [Chloroflexota bacterium]